jgi:hypothetical protein
MSRSTRLACAPRPARNSSDACSRALGSRLAKPRRCRTSGAVRVAREPLTGPRLCCADDSTIGNAAFPKGRGQHVNSQMRLRAHGGTQHSSSRDIGRQSSDENRPGRGRGVPWQSPSSPPSRRSGSVDRVVLLVRTGSEVGVDEGGCSPTRARARCACRSSRIRPAASTPAAPAIAAKEGRGRVAHDAGWPATRSIAQVARSTSLVAERERPELSAKRGKPARSAALQSRQSESRHWREIKVLALPVLSTVPGLGLRCPSRAEGRSRACSFSAQNWRAGVGRCGELIRRGGRLAVSRSFS